MKYLDDYSSYGNEVLYKMCQKEPLHQNIDIIKSKIWIIGRSYSAAVERKAGENFCIDSLAKYIAKSKLDIHIKEIRQIKRSDINNISKILEAHKYFTNIFKKFTGIEKRSLASKYLHFHSPKSVFIYDSIASKKVREIITEHKLRFKLTRNFDDEYEAFCYRCLFYRDNLLEKEYGGFATPRRLDMELLQYGTDI
jgi:hypothetical protein